MKKKIEYGILVLAFMLTTNSCFEWFTTNDEYYNVTIENNSLDTIYTDIMCGNNALKYDFDKLRDFYLERILPDSSRTIPYIEKLPNYKNDKIALIVLKKTTYEKYSIEEIREKRIMDYGIVYSYEELERMGFVIKYAGQETYYEDNE